MKTLLVLAAGLFVAAACGTAGPSATVGQSSPAAAHVTPTPPKASTYNLAVGTTVTLTGSESNWDVTVNSIKKFHSTNEFETPDAGMEFVVIDVTYQAEEGSVDVNPLDWEIKDSDGNLGKEAFADYTLHASTIEAPNKTRGTVVLQIPPGSSGTVVYSTGFAEKASWSFSASDIA